MNRILAAPTPNRPAVVMHCDVPRCLAPVKRAPRILIPNRNADWPGLPPIRIMTTLHYCDTHRASFQLAQYWTDAIKRRVEGHAQRMHAGRFWPDFDAATIEMVLVTTPEYRAFMRDMGVNVVAFA